MEFEGSVALVTGGSSGIGRETARQLVEAGVTVYIAARNADRLNKAAKDIGAIGTVCDVTDQQQVDELFTKIMSEQGKLDVLVNNAGLGAGWSEIGELSMDDMHRVYGINVFGAVMMAQGAAQIFRKQHSGNIVNIGSTASLKGYAKGSIYASSKFALRGLSQCWQADLRPFNVRVMHVNPSYVATAFGTENSKSRPEEDNKLRAKEIAQQIVSQLGMDDRGFVQEVTVWATNPW